MTVPWRGPNATTIMGWHFLPAANAPSTRRSFMFSPEVGDTITWDMVDPRAANIEVTTVHALLDRIEAFGRGEMLISDYKLANVPPASSADAAHDVRLLSLTFRIVLSWPANYKAR